MTFTHCLGLGAGPGLMARSHCTGTGQGTMDFYIMLCTVHITQGQGLGTGKGTGTNGLHTNSTLGPVPGLALSNSFLLYTVPFPVPFPVLQCEQNTPFPVPFPVQFPFPVPCSVNEPLHWRQEARGVTVF